MLACLCAYLFVWGVGLLGWLFACVFVCVVCLCVLCDCVFGVLACLSVGMCVFCVCVCVIA